LIAVTEQILLYTTKYIVYIENVSLTVNVSCKGPTF